MVKNKIGFYIDANNTLPKKPGFVDEWVWIKDLEQFKTELQRFWENYAELPAIISINHDLSDAHVALELKRPAHKPVYYEMYSSDTGLHVLSYLVNFCIENHVFLNRVVTHGLNTTGADNVIKKCNEYYKMCGQDNMSCYHQKWDYAKE